MGLVVARKGLALGAMAAILPGIGLGVPVGAGIGAVTGHFKGAMSKRRPQEAREVLDEWQAGLLVLYKTNMADRGAANIKAKNHYISQQIDADADELARQLKAAEGTS